jgi:AmmeMemoRadiSam system protein B/AmmeMemoRadiSam system protein A
VAGTFYPADSSALASLVDSLLLVDDPAALPPGAVVSGLAPHAGYAYSAATAAAFYRQTAGLSFDLVYVVAPAHTAPVSGFSVYCGQSFLTPLGPVEVDTAAAMRLVEAHPSCFEGGAEHASEHAVEVQLPFLQRALQPGWRLVPVIAGRTDANSIHLLAELLYAEAAHSRILVLASSDLSHYPPEPLARVADSVTMSLWLAGDPEAFLEGTSDQRLPDGMDTFACGRIPLALVLAYDQLYGTCSPLLLDMSTSADAGGDPGQVVGYASAIVTADTAAARAPLSAAARLELCGIVERELASAVTGLEADEPQAGGPELSRMRGVFVTYTSEGMLRGCIGTIRPVYGLGDATAMMARAAALEDPRFPPISERELGSIEYEISVLTPLELLEDPLTVRLGTDGLYIVKDGRSGVLLPQVPGEVGWTTPGEFLDGLCSKAGLPAGAWRDDATIYSFQAEVFGPAPSTP